MDHKGDSDLDWAELGGDVHYQYIDASQLKTKQNKQNKTKQKSKQNKAKQNETKSGKPWGYVLVNMAGKSLPLGRRAIIKSEGGGQV